MISSITFFFPTEVKIFPHFFWYPGVPEKVHVAEKSKNLWYHTESVSDDFKHLIFSPYWLLKKITWPPMCSENSEISGIIQNPFHGIPVI
jgi:hypothetical protein